jgi:hypothetical protein
MYTDVEKERKERRGEGLMTYRNSTNYSNDGAAPGVIFT